MTLKDSDFYKSIVVGFKAAVSNRFGKFILGTSLSSVFSLLFIPEKLNEFITQKFDPKIAPILGTFFDFVLYIFIIVFFIRVLFLSAKEAAILSIRRESIQNSPVEQVDKDYIYANAILMMNEAFAVVHELRRTNFKPFDTSYLKTLVCICNKMKEFFDHKTGSKCSVSIKVLVANTEEQFNYDALVKHICRDEICVESRLLIDNSEGHTISKNTSYQWIINQIRYKKKDRYYINWDVKQMPHYTNSYYVQRDQIPYRSELIVPIIPIDFSSNMFAGGFISIECEEPHKFNTIYDTALARGIAEGIYDVLMA